MEGIFAEPTSCATLAGLDQLVSTGTVRADESVLVSITGFGLKDSKNAAKAFDAASQDA
jgi:threonine synthase